MPHFQSLVEPSGIITFAVWPLDTPSFRHCQLTPLPEEQLGTNQALDKRLRTRTGTHQHVYSRSSRYGVAQQHAASSRSHQLVTGMSNNARARRTLAIIDLDNRYCTAHPTAAPVLIFVFTRVSCEDLHDECFRGKRRAPACHWSSQTSDMGTRPPPTGPCPAMYHLIAAGSQTLSKAAQ